MSVNRKPNRSLVDLAKSSFKNSNEPAWFQEMAIRIEQDYVRKLSKEELVDYIREREEEEFLENI